MHIKVKQHHTTQCRKSMREKKKRMAKAFTTLYCCLCLIQQEQHKTARSPYACSKHQRENVAIVAAYKYITDCRPKEKLLQVAHVDPRRTDKTWRDKSFRG